MREIRKSGSMSGSVETEHGMRLLRHERGNPDTELCRSLRHRATSRLYPYYECSVTITSTLNRVENDEQLVLVQKTVGQGFPNRSI